MISEKDHQEQRTRAPLYWTIGGLVALIIFVVGCVMMITTRKPATGSSLAIDFTKPVNAMHGARLYQVSCATCHGPVGKGLPHQGAPLVGSSFLMTADEKQVIQMVKIGRTPNDPKSVMQLPMPARGGYSNLSDQDLRDIVAHIKALNLPAAGKVSVVSE